MYIRSPAGLIQPRIDHLVGARFLKSVFFCWGDSLYKNTSINTNCNPPPQTYYQLPTKICHHRALSLESAVNVRSVEGRCTDPASICSHKSCAFVLNLEFHIRQQGISTTISWLKNLQDFSRIAPSSSCRPNINRRQMVGQAAYARWDK